MQQGLERINHRTSSPLVALLCVRLWGWSRTNKKKSVSRWRWPAHQAAGADRHHAVFESKAGEQNETGEQTGEQNHVLLLFSEGTSNPFIPTTEPARRLSLPISL